MIVSFLDTFNVSNSFRFIRYFIFVGQLFFYLYGFGILKM